MASSSNTGAYMAREGALKREEDAGRLVFVCITNDGVNEHLIMLINLKNVFSAQLPNMPKEYIVRHVMDSRQKSMVVLANGRVVGGITYRPIEEQRFAEIVFCAVSGEEQVKGYGTRMMNHLKQHVRDADGLTHLITFADNNAVRYFEKQGFTREISLESERYEGYIKKYEGGTLMEFKISPGIPYTDLPGMIRMQREALEERVTQLSNFHIVHHGRSGPTNPANIPGLAAAGWTPDQYGHTEYDVPPQSLHDLMRVVLREVRQHPDAWPFQRAVDFTVPDYYNIIKDPMDLGTVAMRVESESYYVTLEMFVADMKRIFSNAKTYNAVKSIYYACAERLETFFFKQIQFELDLIASLKAEECTSDDDDIESETSTEDEDDEEDEEEE